MHDLNQLALEHHQRLPGLVRATLNDFGVSNEVIDRHQLGWEADAITVPVRSGAGRVVFFERWDPSEIGVPLDDLGSVDLFGRDSLALEPAPLVLAEGIHEALVFESHGLPAVAATGTGRFFKHREWAAEFSSASEVLLAYKTGEFVERSRHLPSRREVIDRVKLALPQAKEVVWPSDFDRNEGAFEFFVTSRSKRRRLSSSPSPMRGQQGQPARRPAVLYGRVFFVLRQRFGLSSGAPAFSPTSFTRSPGEPAGATPPASTWRASSIRRCGVFSATSQNSSV